MKSPKPRDGLPEPPPKLTPKQEKFVAAYLANGFKPNDAAHTAGYKPLASRDEGVRILQSKAVQWHVKRQAEEILTPLQMQGAEVLAETARLARANIADFIDHWDDDGAPVFRPFDTIEPALLAAIESIKVTEHSRTDKEGTEHTTKRVEIKLHAKLKALEMLGKHLQLFADTVTHQNPDGSPVGPVIAQNIVVLPDNGRGPPVGAVDADYEEIKQQHG